VPLVAAGHSALLSGLSGRYVRTIENVSYPDFLYLPAQGTVTYVIEGRPTAAWLRPIFAADAPLVALPFGQSRTLLTTVPEAIDHVRDGLVPVGWTSESGLALAGYRLEGPRAGEALTLRLVWQVTDLSPDRAEWFVAPNVHLLARDGQVLANIGRHGKWAYRLALGDVYVERLTVPLPPSAAADALRLSIGQFDPLRGRDYTLFDDGRPVARYEIPITIQPPPQP
jgi:hypothetical protein